jgi:transcriptional regulator with XRE-family HTH domain
MPENIGLKIKEIRDEYNLSQERFAKRIGLSGKTISAYETGRTQPPLKIIDKIVEVYHTPIVSMKREDKTVLKDKIDLIEEELVSLKEILKDSLSL